MQTQMAANRDFSSLLDELLDAAHVVPDEAETAPSVHVDYLAVAEELNHISITPSEAIAEYQALSEDAPPIQPEMEEIFAIEALPSTDPEEIARELCIARISVSHELDRVRRDFAFANHPDRVDPWLRERCELRMQIANQLIDDAKRQLGTRAATV
jgi:hypothetical protein